MDIVDTYNELCRQQRKVESFYRCRVKDVPNDCFAWLTVEQAMGYSAQAAPVTVYEDRAGEMHPVEAPLDRVEVVEEC